MKTRQYNEAMEELNADDAFDFVRDNIFMLIENKSIDAVYKTEEKPCLDYNVMEKYWRRALDICKEIVNLDEDEISNVNSDKVPVILANKYANDFDYRVCEKIVHEIEKNAKKCNSNSFFATPLIDADDIVPQTAKNYSHDVTILESRLKAKICEVCGCTESDRYEIHHVNKVKNLKGKSEWEKIMIAKRRKTIVVCHKCHMAIHHGEKK